MNNKLGPTAAGIASLVPAGNSAVHRLADPAVREAVWIALAGWIVMGPAERTSLTGLVQTINDTHGLALTEPEVSTSLKYVSRSVALHSLPDAVFRSLVEAEQDVTLVMAKRRKLEKLSEKLDEAYLPGADMKPRDIAALQRAYTDLAESIREDQQALGIQPVPITKTETQQTVRRFDLRATLERHGLVKAPAPGGQAPIDVEPEPHPGQPKPDP